MIRLWLQSADDILRGGLGTLPLAPLADVSEAALPAVVKEMQARIQKEAAPPAKRVFK